ncbi:hypothetical protein E3J74_00370 [Candidatus Bathyarchaeota archaeon]|nr:MAG: hypothetical protein E3J74_00370 [Candidatus Bathyarchaeota archaeon]
MRKRTIFGIVMLLVVLSMSSMPVVKAVIYVWDGVHFVEGYEGEWIKYPHPDRVYYGISPYSTQSVDGNMLYHCQLDSAKSITLVATADILCAGLGTYLGGKIGGLYGAVAGFMIGLALGAFITYVSQTYFLDEYNCIWWWLSISFVDWALDNAYTLWYYGLTNPSYATSLVLLMLYETGYIRVGAITFLDAIGAGYPSPPQYTLSISATTGGTTDPAPGTHTYDYGSSVTVTASPSTNYEFDYWLLDGATMYGDEIAVTMNSDHTLKAYFEYSDGGGGGGGCPTLFVWDGEEYAEEGILDIHAESDMTVQHWIQNTLALENGVYKAQLRELDNYTSHIDQVKLYAVDDKGEWYLCPLTYAYHNELGKVKHTLRFDDDNRVDLKPTEIIDLKFAPSISYDKTEYFIFEINGYNLKPLMCLY